MTELPLNQVLCGDCRELMKPFPDNSIDLVVTDPNYGLKFMGLDWDKALPPKKAFEEMVRVLKPGALAFVMSSPRQDLLWRMLKLLEDVGFELTQSYIEWIYKTGFPKAYDVGKGIDKKFGKIRKVVGIRQYAGPSGNNANFGVGNLTFNKSKRDITEPVSDLAKEWDGWKSQTGLKPAHEPILMVNKPFSESTIVDNVLRWGIGAINVDACRIPLTDGGWERSTPWIDDIRGNRYNQPDNPKLNIPPQKANELGRFPANLLVSDKALDDGTTTKSGSLEPHHIIRGDGEGHRSNKIYGTYNLQNISEHPFYGDEGSPYRFFDLDAWAEHHGFLDVPKPDNTERDFGLRGKKQVPKSKFNLSDGSRDLRFDGVIPTPRRNTHPTVKPIKLMAYLIELGCPPDGIVLDPFCGSGTTCIAAKQLTRRYIGIEINPKYHRIAEARISAYPVPLTWFDGSMKNELQGSP